MKKNKSFKKWIKKKMDGAESGEVASADVDASQANAVDDIESDEVADDIEDDDADEEGGDEEKGDAKNKEITVKYPMWASFWAKGRVKGCKYGTKKDGTCKKRKKK